MVFIGCPHDRTIPRDAHGPPEIVTACTVARHDFGFLSPSDSRPFEDIGGAGAVGSRQVFIARPDDRVVTTYTYGGPELVVAGCVARYELVFLGPCGSRPFEYIGFAGIGAVC